MKKIFGMAAAAAFLFSTTSVCSADSFRVGDSGENVAEIQTALSGMGYDVTVDGEFGPATEAAVKEFQISRGADPSGEVESSVYEALLGRKFPVISRGDSYYSKRIVDFAMRHMGVPYVYGGSSPSGFDCSGFVYYVFGKMGIALPRMADEQYEAGRPIPKSALRAGDLVFFSADGSEINHVGIYLRDGDFIHASTEYGIAIDSLMRDYRVTHYAGACRIL